MWNKGKHMFLMAPTNPSTCSPRLLIRQILMLCTSWGGGGGGGWKVLTFSCKHISSATTFKVGKLLVLRQTLVAIYFNQPCTGAYWEQTLARIIIRATLRSQWANYCQPSLKATLQRGGRGVGWIEWRRGWLGNISSSKFSNRRWLQSYIRWSEVYNWCNHFNYLNSSVFFNLCLRKLQIIALWANIKGKYPQRMWAAINMRR